MYPLVLSLSLLKKLSKKNIDIKEQINLYKNLNNIQTHNLLWSEFKKIKFSNNCFDFLTIVKDGEFYYKNIFPKIYENICSKIEARFFIYENNSKDNLKI